MMSVGDVTNIYCPTCRRINRGWLSGYATLRKCTCLTCGTVQVVK